MKLKSLLLGTVAAAGLSGSAYAADLGVTLTALDTCDALGISGLTISSDSNCLAITGGVSYEAAWGDYDLSVAGISSAMGTTSYSDDSGFIDWESHVEAWFTLTATADSSFGRAMAVIEVEHTDDFTAVDYVGASSQAFGVGDAYVSIGDSTILTAGRTGSIANMDQDEPLNYLGLFRSSHVDTGVGVAGMPATGGHVIQVVSDLGNGLDVGIALENINAAPIAGTVVGVVNYSGDGIGAHATVLFDGVSWGAHAGFEGTFDMITVVGAAAITATNWNVLGSASATFDMFTLAVSGEAADGGEWGVGGSASADLTDGVSVDLGARYFDNSVDQAWQVELGMSAALTETITASAEVGYYEDTITAANNVYFGGELAWAPGGGFDAAVSAEANSLGAYKVGFSASKEFE